MAELVSLAYDHGAVREYRHEGTPQFGYHWYTTGRMISVVQGGRDTDWITVGDARRKQATEAEVKAAIAKWVREHPEHVRSASR